VPPERVASLVWEPDAPAESPPEALPDVPVESPADVPPEPAPEPPAEVPAAAAS